ncbi:MAG: glutamate synthase, partial [Ignavibacteriae bacterium]|nr:glutamate synthase [Ignavibacteriota bacterium]
MAELIPIAFENLLKRIYYEYRKNDSIFDLPSRKFYRPNPELDLSVIFCGNNAANPVGPAAGPHTQLAQNIVLSWLAGARILELKTVQIKDELQLTRPCIDMATVGYNTEWSQELRLDESLREYVKASMIIDMLKQSLQVTGYGLQVSGITLETENRKLETVFDISVGYDLAGIQSSQIRSWLQTMRDASQLIDELRLQIPDEFAAFRNLPFKSEIGNSITLSTFHGCPTGEIEKICEFLISEMDFHVIIKMNPPMLGKERLEHLLYEKLGYTDIEVHQKAYETSIKFNEAVDMVRRLQTVASRGNKTIGVKFGNTLEVYNKGNFLKDKIQYLSGQPLHILHLALVDEWRKVFGADFPISFSAGVDANNFPDMVAIGLVPVTTCTDLLRPGGYARLPQYLY